MFLPLPGENPHAPEREDVMVYPTITLPIPKHEFAAKAAKCPLIFPGTCRNILQLEVFTI
eukprot:837155-Amorphochlora_amoeboformis.AAC.1